MDPAAGRTALAATLTDPDGSISGTTWLWERSNNRSDWSNITGATSASYTPVDDDKGEYLQAKASYTDGEDSGKTAQAVSAMPVRAVPTDNEAPVFDPNTSGGYACNNDEAEDVCLHVRRSAPAGSDIYYPARATDPNRDELRYSLGGPDKGLFSIDPSRGTLFTTKAHAYDDPGTDGKFEITIIATDPSGRSDSIVVALEPSGSARIAYCEGSRGNQVPRERHVAVGHLLRHRLQPGPLSVTSVAG